jgi:cytochrome P450
MDTSQQYEAPRIQFVSHRFAPGDELLRWLAEERKLAYAEEAQSLSAPPRVLAAEGEAHGIEAALDLLDRRCRPDEHVYGETDDARQAVRALLKSALATIGRPALQLWLHHALSAPELLDRIAARASRQDLVRTFDLQSFDTAAVEASIGDAFARLEADLNASGQPFLWGAAPGRADIIVAALAAPLVLPPKCGTPYPALEGLPAPLRDFVRKCRDRRLGQLVMSVYERSRPPQQPPLPKATYGPTLIERILNPSVVRFGARLLVRWAPRLALGKRLLVSDWAGVTEVLDRDNDFLIAPINKERIEAVSGPFILGMDRSPDLIRQREHVYAALQGADREPFLSTLKGESNRLLDDAAAAGGRLDVVNGYARLVAGRTAAALFGIAGPTEQDLLRVIRRVFHETFLNLSGDPAVKQSGIAAGQELKEWIEVEQARRLASNQLGNDVLGRLLATSRSDQAAARWMLAGLLVGAIDTTATVVTNIIAEVLGDAKLRRAMMLDLDRPRRLLGWCWEALRRRPHNAGMLRQAGAGAMLGGKPVKMGQQVLALTVGAMHDPAAFDHPTQMIPDRPLERYLHFGRGLHQCSGRDFNAIQVPALVRELLRRHVSGRPRVRTRGPFPDELLVSIRAPG